MVTAVWDVLPSKRPSKATETEVQGSIKVSHGHNIKLHVIE